MKPIDFYQSHLNRVSRSFAACIARLEGPLRSWVSLTYLICRVLDTVEDALWTQNSMQMRSFDELGQFVKSAQPPSKLALSQWVKTFPPGLPEGEKLLLSDTSTLLTDLISAPEGVKRPIFELVKSMSAGMRHFAEKRVEAKGRLELRGLSEVNQYCFFVAGIVGETLSKLLVAIEPEVRLSRDLLVDAHHFGLFLQKVNLLKDQVKDEQEGRFLVPARDELFLSLHANAEGALRYIEAMPRSRVDYRVFCAWSLFLGLRTLPLLKSGQALKLERTETEQLFRDLENWVQSDTLRYEFGQLLAAADLGENSKAVLISTRNTGAIALPDWFKQSYSGLLTASDIQALGLI